jgi:hypothetical protein
VTHMIDMNQPYVPLTVIAHGVPSFAAFIKLS